MKTFRADGSISKGLPNITIFLSLLIFLIGAFIAIKCMQNIWSWLVAMAYLPVGVIAFILVCRLNKKIEKIEYFTFLNVDEKGMYITGYDYPYDDISKHKPLTLSFQWTELDEIKMRIHSYYNQGPAEQRLFLIIKLKLSKKIPSKGYPKKNIRKLELYIPGSIIQLSKRKINNLIDAINYFSKEGTIVEWSGTKNIFWA